MAKFNIDKIYAELRKLSEDDLYSAFGLVKNFVQNKLAAAQAQKENEATELQSKIDRLAGN